MSFPRAVSTNQAHAPLRRSFLAAFLLVAAAVAAAQSPKTLPVQQLRGTVTDAVLRTPLSGATVSLPLLARLVVTDAQGLFRFADVPVGNYQLIVSMVGYKETVLENIGVNTGKETVLTIAAEGSTKRTDTLTVKASGRRNRPQNDMSAVSARAFTVEETQKYAAAVNDPLRMATGFAGVVGADDGNNNIIIRGNSPAGLLWRMEGVDIPNPNHFAGAGSSGGGISILSAQLLANSDFVTGAFAAEYGNAVSGVFDLRLRKGNNEKKEYTVQAGLLGLNVAAEGPFKKGYGGSYLVNYRYSTLQMLNKLGLSLGNNSTNFQDLSFNIHLPTKKLGTFGLFGFGGLSSQEKEPVRDSSKWTDRDERDVYGFRNTTGAAGLTHTVAVGSKTTLRSAAAWSYTSVKDEAGFVQSDYTVRPDAQNRFANRRLTLTSTATHKFSPRSSLRTGVIFTRLGFNFFQRERENEQAPLLVQINESASTQTLQGFGQWQYKPADNLTLNGGLHYLRLGYNGTTAVEPRASMRWQAGRATAVAFGYGRHSQVHPLGVYFAREGANDFRPNRSLGFTKADHYVLSFQRNLSRNLSVKIETYYQRLMDVPVSRLDSSTLSLLNVEQGYVTDPLVNRGRGRNYGVEVSLERYLRDGFYYSATTSIYQSKYTAADGVERSTRFNGGYVATFLGGKEFVAANGLRSFGLNVKTVYAGGLRYTPLNIERSRAEGYAVYREGEAFSLQNPAYLRADLRLSLTWNRLRRTNTLSLDVQNVLARRNVFGQVYDADKAAVRTVYQAGIIPVLNYKVEF